MRYLSPAIIKQYIDSGDAQLLDIREPYEQEVCSIGGIKMPMANVLENAHLLDKQKMTVVMCRSGKRAEALANLLESECGFEDIVVMEGGILGWIDQVDPSLEIEG